MDFIPANLRKTPDAQKRIALEAAAQEMNTAAVTCGLKSTAYETAKEEYEALLKKLNYA